MSGFEGPRFDRPEAEKAPDAKPNRSEGFRQGTETANGREVIKKQYKHLEDRILQAMEQKRVDGINGEKAARRELASSLRMNHPGKFESLADRIEKGIGSVQW